MENETKKQPHGSPGSNAFFSLLILGLPYLWMRLYRRFFVVYGLVVAMVVAAVAGILTEDILSFLPFAVAVGTAIDIYAQTKKMNAGEIIFPDKNKALYVLGIISIIALFALAVLGALAEPGPDGESPIQEFLDDRAQQRRENQITAQFPVTRDTYCDAFKTDPRLVVDNFHANFSFTEYCYFKKAVETEDPSNCLGYHESLGFNDDCLGYLAYLNGTPDVCTEMATHQVLCESAYRYQEPLNYPCDSARMPSTIFDICLSEFESFYLSLPPSPYGL